LSDICQEVQYHNTYAGKEILDLVIDLERDPKKIIKVELDVVGLEEPLHDASELDVSIQQRPR
jgi:hypothetical protein